MDGLRHVSEISVDVLPSAVLHSAVALRNPEERLFVTCGYPLGFCDYVRGRNLHVFLGPGDFRQLRMLLTSPSMSDIFELAPTPWKVRLVESHVARGC